MSLTKPLVTVNGVKKAVRSVAWDLKGELSDIVICEDDTVKTLLAPDFMYSAWHDVHGTSYEVEFEDVTLYANMPF